MTKEEQLKQLIADEDISPGFANYDEGYKLYSVNNKFDLYTFKSFDGLEHFTSYHLHEIVRQCYYEHLEHLFCKDRIELGFSHVIQDRLYYWPQSKEMRLKLLEDLIIEKARIKDALELNEVAVSFCKSALGDSYCNVAGTIESESENLWFMHVYNKGLEIFSSLKYKVYNGGKIELDASLKMTIVAEIFYSLGDDILEDIFKNVLILKKIDYLKQQVISLKDEGTEFNKKKHPDFQKLNDIFEVPPRFATAINSLNEVITDPTIAGLKQKIKVTGIIMTWYQALKKNNWLHSKIESRTEVIAPLLCNHFKGPVITEKTLRPAIIDGFPDFTPVEGELYNYFLGKFPLIKKNYY